MNIRHRYFAIVVICLLPIACAQTPSQPRSGTDAVAADSDPIPTPPTRKPRNHATESWESNPTDKLPTNCTNVERSLIVPIPAVRRADAIARLANRSSRRLTEKQVVAILNLRSSSDASASGRIEHAIAALTQQKRLAEEKAKGSWSSADQDRLQKLEAFASGPTPEKLKPYLLRGVARYEATGGFEVSSCDAGVFIVWHLALVPSPNASTRLPLVVFLETAPKKVIVYASAYQ